MILFKVLLIGLLQWAWSHPYVPAAGAAVFVLLIVVGVVMQRAEKRRAVSTLVTQLRAVAADNR